MGTWQKLWRGIVTAHHFSRKLSGDARQQNADGELALKLRTEQVGKASVTKNRFCYGLTDSRFRRKPTVKRERHDSAKESVLVTVRSRVVTRKNNLPSLHREVSGRIFYFIGNSHKAKALRAESHCGGKELCRRCDPPQAENPASRILSYKD